MITLFSAVQPHWLYGQKFLRDAVTGLQAANGNAFPHLCGRLLSAITGCMPPVPSLTLVYVAVPLHVESEQGPKGVRIIVYCRPLHVP